MSKHVNAPTLPPTVPKRRSGVIRLGLLALALGASASTYAASFDCRAARSFSEKAVCQDDKLSALDDQLGSKYRRALAATSDRKTLTADRDSQWHWRQQNCRDIKCVLDWYERRISELDDVILTASAEHPAKIAATSPKVAHGDAAAAKAPVAKPAKVAAVTAEATKSTEPVATVAPKIAAAAAPAAPATATKVASVAPSAAATEPAPVTEAAAAPVSTDAPPSIYPALTQDDARTPVTKAPWWAIERGAQANQANTQRPGFNPSQLETVAGSSSQPAPQQMGISINF